MNQLLIYEWKKILTSRLNQILLIVSLLATSGMMLSAALSYTFPEEGDYLKGMDAIQAEKEEITKISGAMDQQQIEQTVAQYQALYEVPGNSFNNEGQISLVDSVFLREVYPKYHYLLLINSTYAGPYASDYELNMLKKITQPLPDFYEARAANVEQILSNTYSNMQFSKSEQDYWLHKNEQVQTPIEYGYTQGWTKFLNQIEFFVFVLLVIVIAIAPVFANEYQTGAHQIILSTKFGKTKLILAKILVAFVFGLVVLTIHFAIMLVIVFFTFGLDGASLPVQALHGTNPYDWTIGQFVAVQVLTVYALLFGLIGLTLWLSAKVKSAFVAIVPMIASLMIPLFLNRTETYSVWNKIHSLLPFPSMRNTLGNDELTFVSFSIGGSVIDLFTLRFVLYVVMGCMMIFFARRAFKHHQVK